MPFTHESARQYGGAKPGAGRKPKRELQIKKAAAVIAREFIEQNIQPVLDTYLGLAAGKVVERNTKKGKQVFRLLVDPPTTRHVIDKLLPEIKPDANTRPIAIQIVHESAKDVTVESQGNGVKIHLGSE